MIGRILQSLSFFTQCGQSASPDDVAKDLKEPGIDASVLDFLVAQGLAVVYRDGYALSSEGQQALRDAGDNPRDPQVGHALWIDEAETGLQRDGSASDFENIAIPRRRGRGGVRNYEEDRMIDFVDRDYE
jgi:hypothetical protein